MLGSGRLSAVGAVLLSLLASACGAAEDSAPPPQDIHQPRDPDGAGSSTAPATPSVACA
ncbi:MAG: hypothetical protein K0S65_4474, partial [Labilithrix sp.]|nr:hypothetical protein [Labilithrix sp.]